ncbi:MAG: hypothetical protein IKM64_00980 [Clostridia bacterium]|nr:hypothetical protein [Clostridia bacterium]
MKNHTEKSAFLPAAKLPSNRQNAPEDGLLRLQLNAAEKRAMENDACPSFCIKATALEKPMAEKKRRRSYIESNRYCTQNR